MVEVDATNNYYVQTAAWEREAPSRHELLIALREARWSDPAGPPSRMLVKADPDSLHEKVVAALDAGTRAGMEEVQLAMIE